MSHFIITGCSKCPCLDSDEDGYDCNHPENVDDLPDLRNVSPEYELKEGYTPGWCPLRKVSLSIILLSENMGPYGIPEA